MPRPARLQSCWNARRMFDMTSSACRCGCRTRIPRRHRARAALLIAVSMQRGDEQRMEPDAPATPLGLRRGLPDVRLSPTSSAAQRRRCSAPSESMSTKHQRRPASSPGRSPHIRPGQPHRRTAVGRDGVDQQALGLLDGEALARASTVAPPGSNTSGAPGSCGSVRSRNACWHAWLR